MAQNPTLTPLTLTFAKFWAWIQVHPNCILRAGTPEAVLYDDDTFHWHFSVEEDGTYLVQVIQGKKLLGELAITPADITYVHGEPGEGEEFRFELVSETEANRLAAYHFVLSHGFEDQDESPKRFTH
jgi:hypothetical protein